MTLREFASRIGVSENYAYLLQAKKALAAAHRDRLAQVFSVPADKVAPLDEKAVVRRRGAGAAARTATTKTNGDIAGALAAARAAVDAIGTTLGKDGLEVPSLMAKMSPANRQTLVTLARLLAGKGWARTAAVAAARSVGIGADFAAKLDLPNREEVETPRS